MSLFKRPQGDDVAKIYGKYLSKRDISSLKVGDKLDALCEDGLNYQVEIKSKDDDTSHGLLHFLFWGRKYDYHGPLDNLYLAPIGKYSIESGITPLNNYSFLIDKKDDKLLSKSQTPKFLKTGNNSTSTGVKSTKYPDDFFAKPRFTSRRKYLEYTPDNNYSQGDDREMEDEKLNSDEEEEEGEEGGKKTEDIEESNENGHKYRLRLNPKKSWLFKKETDESSYYNRRPQRNQDHFQKGLKNGKILEYDNIITEEEEEEEHDDDNNNKGIRSNSTSSLLETSNTKDKTVVNTQNNGRTGGVYETRKRIYSESDLSMDISDHKSVKLHSVIKIEPNSSDLNSPSSIRKGSPQSHTLPKHALLSVLDRSKIKSTISHHSDLPTSKEPEGTTSSSSSSSSNNISNNLETVIIPPVLFMPGSDTEQETESNHKIKTSHISSESTVVPVNEPNEIVEGPLGAVKNTKLSSCVGEKVNITGVLSTQSLHMHARQFREAVEVDNGSRGTRRALELLSQHPEIPDTLKKTAIQSRKPQGIAFGLNLKQWKDLLTTKKHIEEVIRLSLHPSSSDL